MKFVVVHDVVGFPGVKRRAGFEAPSLAVLKAYLAATGLDLDNLPEGFDASVEEVL